jgi:hypothetical protein
MRLLLISAGTLLVFGILLLMARMWGLSQGYQAFSHPFLEAPKPWIAVQVHDLATADTALQKKKDVIFWLDLAKTQDGQFLVVDPNSKIQLTPELMKEQYHGEKTYFYDLKVLRLAYDKEPLLPEFLERYPKTRMILNIRDNAMGIHTALQETIKKFNASDRVLFQSDIELVLRSLKDLEPLWLFGTTRSDIMRLLNFDSVGLLPACPYYADVFVSSFKVLGRPAFNQNVLNEVRRRKKSIILGPLENEAEVIDARRLNPDGYIYGNTQVFMSELDQHPAQ